MSGYIGNEVLGELFISGQTAGDVVYYNGTDWVRLPKGTASQVLKMNSGATAVEWGAESEYNDSSIRSDILKLAIHQAVEGNRVAYNLENSFIDGFEDDTGITTETTVDRDTTGEYVGTRTLSSSLSGTKHSVTSSMLSHTGLSSWNAGEVVDGDVATGGGGKGFYVASGTSSGEMVVDLGSGNAQAFGKIRSYTAVATNAAVWTIAYSDNGSAWTNTSLTNFAPGASSYDAWFEGTWTSAGEHRYWKMFISSGSGTGQGWVGHEIEWYAFTETVNATGTLISDAQTASSSRTSCSGVIIYEDSEGVATLGSDLKIYFTANNGTNWTEAASYATAITYSGTKKLVKLGATTCVAGTAIAMKSVWANQAQSADAVYAWQTGNRSINVTGSPSVSSGNYANWVDGDTTLSSSNAWYWDDNGTVDSNRWIKFDFDGVDGGSGATRIIQEFRYHSGGYSGANPDSGTFKWQGSNDDTNWTDIGSNWAMATNAGWNTFSTTVNNNTTAYRYYKIVGVSGTSHNPWMSEIEFKAQTQTAVAGKQTHLHGWAVNY